MLCPEVLGQDASEDSDEEESAVQLDDHNRDSEGALVDGGNAESKQHESDTGFDCHVGEDVEWLAKPPVLSHKSAWYDARPCWFTIGLHIYGPFNYLQADRDLSWEFDIGDMLPSSMIHTNDGKRDIQNEHDLSSVNIVHLRSNDSTQFTQAAAAKPSSHGNAFCMYERRYIRNEKKIVVRARKKV